METRLLSLGSKIHNALVECSRKENQFSDNLEGACAIASALFVKEAHRMFGIHLTFKATAEHAWTVYKDNVYDLTATQFGHKEKVFTMPYKHIETMKDCYMRNCYTHTESRTLDRINEVWPAHQRPINYRLNWINQHIARVVFLGKVI